jgi:hypothetical protein
MQVSLFNSNSPNGKRIPVTISIEHSDLVSSNDGELLSMIVLDTGAIGISGGRVPPVYLNNVTEPSILKEIKNGLTTMGQQIDWGIVDSDKYPPTITELIPGNGNQDVGMETDVEIELKDPFPSSFIDTSTIKLSAEGIDVTNEVNIVEKEGKVRLHWSPRRVY